MRSSAAESGAAGLEGAVGVKDHYAPALRAHGLDTVVIYVAATRARDLLVLTGHGERSSLL
jgi:hypothetical protein